MIDNISSIFRSGLRKIAFIGVFLVLIFGWYDNSQTQNRSVYFQIGYRVCEIISGKDQDSESPDIKYAGVPTDRFPLGFFFVAIPYSLALDLNFPESVLSQGGSQDVVEIYTIDGSVFVEQEVLPPESVSFISNNCAMNIRNRQN